MTLQEAEKQLKPCPFCRSAPVIGEYSYGGGNYGRGHQIEIHCNHCNVKMVCSFNWRGIKNCQKELQEAIEKWNSRSN